MKSISSLHTRIVLIAFLLTLSFPQCTQAQLAPEPIKKRIGTQLDHWHKAAAEARLSDYFSLMSRDMIFIGTDATEHWNYDAFYAFCKPYFEKGKTWHFTTVQRHIYYHPQRQMVWFDELLDTQMKLCRGSGVWRKEKGEWKLVQYVLSMTIPNEHTQAVVKIKAPHEDSLKLIIK